MAALQQLVDIGNSELALLSSLASKLDNIYSRLEHVKVDSYVNVRLMDITGELPVPCDDITGLLVSAYAVPGGMDVNVVNSFVPCVPAGGVLPVYVDNTAVPVTIDNMPHVVVDSGDISVDNVVHVVVDSGTVATQPQVKIVGTSSWVDQVGLQPSNLVIQDISGAALEPIYGTNQGLPVQVQSAMGLQTTVTSETSAVALGVSYYGTSPPWPYVNVHPNP